MEPFTESAKPKKKRWILRIFLTIVLLGALVAGGAALYARRWYDQALRPVSTTDTKAFVTVEEGSSVHAVGLSLEEAGVIRSSRAFDWYARTRPDTDQIKAGTYEFSQTQSVKEILDQIVTGAVAKNLFTILPGKRIDQIRQAFIEAEFNAAEVDAALDPANYPDHPALADKPIRASLEGYLYPDSYQKIAETTPEDIVSLSLDEMADKLTPALRKAIANRGLSVHEGVTLASVIEREVSSPKDRATVAQVFFKRLREGMPLGADATFYYAAAVTGETPSPDMDNPYNTRRFAGLPPGPISNVSVQSLTAVANPAEGDYLFFVSGDDGVTRFTRTEAEHLEAVEKYCDENCKIQE